MKRTLSLMAALLLTLSFALAETSAYDALAVQYDALLQREEAIGLEMQIIDLQLQLARLNGDGTALAAHQAQQDALLAERAAIAGQKTELSAQLLPAISALQLILREEEARLRHQLASLEAALSENITRQQSLSDEFADHLRLGGLTASAKGFASDVTVYVLPDAQGAVTALLVDAPWETPGLGACCEDEAFTSQFIGQTGPFTIGVNVDALSHATVTSKAVVKALNEALGLSGSPVLVEHCTAARGLLSDVWVTITRNTDGSVATITVDCSGETEAIARPCTQEPFLSQFIGQTGPFVPGENVDVVSGATFTSMAVVEALNSLLTPEEGADVK